MPLAPRDERAPQPRPAELLHPREEDVRDVPRQPPRRRAPGAVARGPRGHAAGARRGAPEHYFRPPYVGHRGWLGVRLDRDLAWDEIAGAIEDAYLTVAPKSLIEAAGLAGGEDAGNRTRRDRLRFVSTMPGAIVIGAGPGIGTSVAQRFAREGLPVAVLARSRATVDTALACPGRPRRRDARRSPPTSPTSRRCARRSTRSVDRVGVPEVLVYNAALIQSDVLGELTARQHLDAWAVNVVGAITAIAHLGPGHDRRPGRGHDPHHRRHARAGPRGDEPVAGQGRRPRAHRAAWRAPTSRPASTSRPSPWPARWRRARPSTPTRSPRSTGGCTRSPPARGSARSLPRASYAATRQGWRPRAGAGGGTARPRPPLSRRRARAAATPAAAP